MYTIAHLAIYMAMYGMVAGMSIGVSGMKQARS